ncbi:MAG: DUF6431 domain-containing protein [Succinivibrio sp.]|nr:DUF6431 domain-containing protein [Succinivibrio sp.]MDY6262350.1 DUF6431 domain-containing protein [Succinivibrio sp.]
MFIVPHQLYGVDLKSSLYPKFELTVQVLLLLSLHVGTSDIRIHSYVRRTIKQIGMKARLILIPKIICRYGDSVRIHTLLPDFLLPYCNYTVKSLATILIEHIPLKTIGKITLDEWNRTVALSARCSSLKQAIYITSRQSFLFLRYKSMAEMVFNMKIMTDAPLYSAWKQARSYYFFDKNSKCIRVLDYLDHSISFFNSS